MIDQTLLFSLSPVVSQSQQSGCLITEVNAIQWGESLVVQKNVVLFNRSTPQEHNKKLFPKAIWIISSCNTFWHDKKRQGQLTDMYSFMADIQMDRQIL